MNRIKYPFIISILKSHEKQGVGQMPESREAIANRPNDAEEASVSTKSARGIVSKINK